LVGLVVVVVIVDPILFCNGLMIVLLRFQ